jgi:hypothetical protein
LHVDPPRYGGWTVDQMAGALMVVGGVITVIELIRLDRGRKCIMTSPEALACEDSVGS